VRPAQDRQPGSRRRPLQVAGIVAALILGVGGGASAQAATDTVSPLPASNYTVRPVCAAPTPGRASCLALELVPKTAAARAHMRPLGMTRSVRNGASEAADVCASPSAAEGCYGLRPADLRDAYFPGEPPEAPASEPPQTIAIVDAYNDPQARADLEAYEHEFGLSACPAAQSSCFAQVNQEGNTTKLPFPASEAEREAQLAICEDTIISSRAREAACSEVEEAENWAVEISTDIEVARAVCHNCKVLLVEANEPVDFDLEVAEQTAARSATEISNSWGGEEPTNDSKAFNHPRVPITAAAGDDGYLNWTEAAEAKEAAARGEKTGYFVGANYPASSPHVIGVGGTSLTLRAGVWQDETVWNDSFDSTEENAGAGGSGCSSQFEAPIWQRDVPDWAEVGCANRRAVADIAADADPYTGVAVYDSVPDRHEEDGEVVNTPLGWWPIGGTSVASPIIASMFALAGGSHGVEYPAQTLYSHLETDLLHPVATGGNGECNDLYTTGCTGSINPTSPRFAFDCGEEALICNAAAECEGHYYAGPAGVGTPNGIGLFKPEDQPSKDGVPCTKKGKSGNNGAPGGSGSNTEGTNSGTSGEQGKAAGKGETGPLSNQPSTPTPTPSATNPTTPATSSSEITAIPTISGLALTKTATAALSHGRPNAPRIAFAFTLNVAAHVRVSLSVRVRAHGHKHWQTLAYYTFTIAAAKGRDSAHLRAHGTLAPGRYRLTLTPAGGRARTLTFQVG
jgi:hypothetical protein